MQNERNSGKRAQKGGKHAETKSTGGRRKLWISILIAAIAVAVILIVVLAQMGRPAEQPKLPEITAQESQTPSASILSTTQSAGLMEGQMLPAMEQLYEKNSDLAGWIRIEGTVVDYPVMYTPEDGEFYLYRTFEKEDDPTKEGCIFIDKNCTVEPRSTNLLLHGHNMKNGTMFHTLLEYKDEEFYSEHPTIHYNTLYEEQEYEIFAVFLSKIYKKSETDVFKFYQFYHAENEEEFDEYVQNCKELSLYDTGITPEYGDELITLSTCEYTQANGRIVVVARKVTPSDSAE